MENVISFEDAMKELETVVESLENGNLTLEEALDMFEKGINLTAICNKKLDVAEKRITVLLENKDGSFQEKDFLSEDNQ